MLVDARSNGPTMEALERELRSMQARQIGTTLWHLLYWQGSYVVMEVVAKALDESDVATRTFGVALPQVSHGDLIERPQVI